MDGVMIDSERQSNEGWLWAAEQLGVEMPMWLIDSFKGGEGPETFSSPQDVAVTDDGYIFIADTNNSRILKLDMDLNYVMEFTKPVDATFDQDLSFLPYKLAIDTAGRV